MGAQTSVEIAKPFVDISKCIFMHYDCWKYQLIDRTAYWYLGSKARLDSVIQGYVEGEYDFGIDITALKSITGYDSNDANELLHALSKNDTGL